MTSSIIGRTAGKLLMPFIFIFGFYVVIHGHLTPGGGFQGGAVIATGVALILVCYYYNECVDKYLSLTKFKLIETAGLVMFVCTALSGIVLASGFLFNWSNAYGGFFGTPVEFGVNAGNLLTGGLIPVLNFAVGIEVFGALSVVLLCMFAGLKEMSAEEEEAQ